MHPSIFFALCVACVATLYQVFQRQVSGVNPYLVAITVSASAVLLGGIFTLFGGKISSADLVQTKYTWLFLVLIGFCAFGIDFFYSKAYTAGGNVSIIGPIVTSGVVVLSGIFGALFFKEPLTLMKALGLIFMTVGMFLTAWKK